VTLLSEIAGRSMRLPAPLTRAVDVEHHASHAGIGHAHGRSARSRDVHVRRRRDQRNGWSRRLARARRSGREREKCEETRDACDASGHRPMTVYVTVAVYRPGGTVGNADVKLTFVGQASPPAELVDAVVPMSRSGAGAIGIAALAPAPSCGPIWPPVGADAVMPSGRSAGWKAERWTVSA